MSNVVVVGAGVTGLTTAVVLLENGHRCHVVFDQPPMNTTSAVATAVWHIYLVDASDTAVLRWSSRTLDTLNGLAVRVPEAGVSLVAGKELFRSGSPIVPSWTTLVPTFRMLTSEECSAYTGVAWGYFMETPLADMATYLPWLLREAERRGATFECRRIDSLEDEALRTFDAVVNCTGLGARELSKDDCLVGVRGQYLILERPPQCDAYYIGDDWNPRGISYVFPRPSDYLVGGTEEHGEESMEFSEDVNELLSRAALLQPWLSDNRHIAIRAKVVGIRPMRRGGPRVERDTASDGRLIHNYGHGGSGFSLAWGCAEEVSMLVAN